MSRYLSQITEPLIECFESAARLTDHRLNGYAANVEFWANEVAHRLAVLRGFASRQRAFGKAMQSAVDRLRRESAYENPTKLHYGEGIPSSQQESQVESVKQLEGRLIDAAKSFFRKLNRSQLIEQDVWYRLQDRFEFL